MYACLFVYARFRSNGQITITLSFNIMPLQTVKSSTTWHYPFGSMGRVVPVQKQLKSLIRHIHAGPNSLQMLFFRLHFMV
jgi:hypothetical protein